MWNQQILLYCEDMRLLYFVFKSMWNQQILLYCEDMRLLYFVCKSNVKSTNSLILWRHAIVILCL